MFSRSECFINICRHKQTQLANNYYLFLFKTRKLERDIFMKNCYTIILLFLTTLSFGQNYGHIWQFGNRAGIDFKNCDPQPILTGENTGFEGVSSISDDQGQLQFYTNSDTVWNKLNLAMPNGYLISTSGTLSQVLIIPKPQSNSQYYIVTTKIQASGSLTLQYHVVDMSLMEKNPRHLLIDLLCI